MQLDLFPDTLKDVVEYIPDYRYGNYKGEMQDTFKSMEHNINKEDKWKPQKQDTTSS